MKNFRLILVFLLIGQLTKAYSAVLTAIAGPDQVICPGVLGTLSGSASGGISPFSYHWEPAGFCTTPNSAITTINITTSTAFTLTVIDAGHDTAQDVVYIGIDDFKTMGAGPDQGRCLFFGNPVTLGNVNNYQGGNTFNWLPAAGLSSASVPNPTASPTVTTTYTLTINSAFCGSIKDSVTVSVWTINVDAGPNQTILEGQTITLSGSGATDYLWTPNVSIMYANTQHPDVNPSYYIAYYLQAFDDHGCVGYDSVQIFVRPDDGLYFYNTFTPNGDGSNDTWVISNIHKFPDNKLEIYNRYGQLIYKKNGYNNDWNGQYLGQELPSGTYFYLMDTNSDKGKFKGSVTIMR